MPETANAGLITLRGDRREAAVLASATADGPHSLRRAAVRAAVDQSVGQAGDLVLRGARRAVRPWPPQPGHLAPADVRHELRRRVRLVIRLATGSARRPETLSIKPIDKVGNWPKVVAWVTASRS